MAAPCLEADYCDRGVFAIADAVVSGARGPELLFRPVRCVCIAGAHTEGCCRDFHHHEATVPTAVATAVLNACFEGRDALPGFQNGLLLALNVAPDAVEVVGHTKWRAHPVVPIIVHHLLIRRALTAAAMAAVITELPRDTLALEPAIGCPADAAAAFAIDSYRGWLTHKTQTTVLHACSWENAVRAACVDALTSRLPSELVAAIVALVV